MRRVRAGELAARWPVLFDYGRLWRVGARTPGVSELAWPWFLVDEECLNAQEAEARLLDLEA